MKNEVFYSNVIFFTAKILTNKKKTSYFYLSLCSVYLPIGFVHHCLCNDNNSLIINKFFYVAIAFGKKFNYISKPAIFWAAAATISVKTKTGFFVFLVLSIMVAFYEGTLIHSTQLVGKKVQPNHWTSQPSFSELFECSSSCWNILKTP